MKIKLIANPVAGGNALASIRRAEQVLARRGATVDLFLTGARGDARREAAAARTGDFELVIAAGGDGTLNEVINGLAPSDIPLAFIPLGTTNVFALEVGIPFDVEEACRISLEGEPHRICLGQAGATRFLLMAGIGFDAEVVYRVSGNLKRWSGKFAYVASAFRRLCASSPDPIEVVREDGSVVHGYGAILGNCRLYAGRRFSITPDACLHEESLDVSVFLRPGRLSLLRSAMAVIAGVRLVPPAVETFKASEVTVRGEGVPVQLDGDYLGRLPIVFRAKAGEITLVLPRAAGPSR